jgi:hypothetical protein
VPSSAGNATRIAWDLLLTATSMLCAEDVAAAAATKDKVENLVTFMRRLKNSVSHAMLSDSLSASALDDMWEETNVSVSFFLLSES